MNKGKGKEKQARRGLATSKDTLHESAHLQKRKERAITGSATVDAAQLWLHPKAVELLAARKARAKFQTSPMEKEVCPS